MNDLAETVQSRIERFCLPEGPEGLGIDVNALVVDDWAGMPLPELISMTGWIDPVATDGHPSGQAFVYCPEVIADSIKGLDFDDQLRYLDAVLLYVTIYVALTERHPDPDERHRQTEDILYDKHYDRLALMSLVQTGGAR